MKLTIKELLLASTLCAFAAGVQAADPDKAQRESEYKATVAHADAEYKAAKDACKARQGRRHCLNELAGHFKLAALSRLIDSSDDLDQGTLAAAILASDTLHFAGQHFETDILQGLHTAEGHTNVAERQHRCLVLLHNFGDAHRQEPLVILKCSQKYWEAPSRKTATLRFPGEDFY